LNFVDDLDLRLHHRSQMEAAGLRHITEACQRFHHPVLDKQLQFLQTTLDEDELRLRERLDKARSGTGILQLLLRVYCTISINSDAP
jgi:cytokinesis protein